MGYVLDTNVLSEIRLGAGRCNKHVWDWYTATPLEDLFLSVIVLGEVRKGAELKRRRDPMAARILERWLHNVIVIHRERILDVTYEICDLWGHISAFANVSTTDGLIAATATHLDLTVATRNTRDFQRCGVDYVNPFEA